MDADGNCLFRSLSDQLTHDYGSNHADVRDKVCNYMAGHKNFFCDFVALNDNDEDAPDFETYVSNMRQDGEWGDHVELVAASRLYR